MERSQVGRARRGLSPALRVAACMLMAVIATDLVTDAECDAIGLGTVSTTTIRAAGPDGVGEACAEVCVQDCFCCSRAVAATPVVLALEPRPLTTVEAPAPERWGGGIRSGVDHIPLLPV